MYSRISRFRCELSRWLVLWLLLPLAMTAAAGTARTVAEPRSVTALEQGWLFQFGPADATVTTAAFDDSAWQKVQVPHTWNRLGEYAVKRSAATDNRQGKGWYRLRLPGSKVPRGQRLYLDFAAVGNLAEVWVNGTRVGEHRGAFSRFRFDVTPLWQVRGENLVVVSADNSKPAPGSSTSEILPLAGDFFIHGGLYRPVSLVLAPEAGIDLLDFGGPGVYARATFDPAGAGVVNILTRLRNASSHGRRLQAVASVRDAEGQVVAESSAPAGLPAAGTSTVTQTLQVATPRRWDGRRDPYLYQVSVELRDGKQVVDRVVQPLGFREYRFDANAGFFLNGRHVPLYGASRHQDRAEKGWALSAADHVEDMALMVEMGLNTVRMAHYQHDDRWVDEADRHGMVAWAEVPYVSASAFDGTVGTPATFANAEQQTRELVRQQYNHPSILMWSVGNEVDASAIFLNNGKAPRSLKLLQFINRIAKEEDPWRPTVFADCCEPTPGSNSNPFTGAELEPLAGTADLIGYNRYYGWYYSQPAEIGVALDRFHEKHPTLPMSVSEYGAGGALSQHSDNPLGGAISAFGRPHPEEYQSWYHEENFAELVKRPYVFATWIWNMFDFASDLREEGEAIDLNDKGLVTFDRRTRKDAFYFYQARLSDRPVLHLAGKRYVGRAYPVVDVKAYSNATEAVLTVNGRAIGTAPCADGQCAWKNVRLEAGANAVEVAAVIGGQSLRDRTDWQGPDPRMGLRIDAGDLTGHRDASGNRYGSDHFFAGGTPRTLNPAVFKGSKAPPRREVAGATDAAMFENYREGASNYRLPLPDGHWNIRIHTFEPAVTPAAERVFSISVDGKTVLPALAPARLGGGSLHAASVTLPVDVRGGEVVLAFGDAAVVAAIEVVP